MRGNVLFVTADPRRGECPSALGHPVVRTRALDVQAEQTLTHLQLGPEGVFGRREARRR